MIEAFGLWTEQYDGSSGGKLVQAEEGEKFLGVLDIYETWNSVSSLCADRKRKLLFATLEVRERTGRTGGYLVQFSYEKQKLKLVQKTESFGAYPISLILSESFAIILNHGSTQNWILKTRLCADGSLEVYREYVEASPHSLTFDREAGEIYIPERGADRVTVLRIDAEQKKFEYAGEIPGKKGYGPRNICGNGTESSTSDICVAGTESAWLCSCFLG